MLSQMYGIHCFKWAFLAVMHPTKIHTDRLRKYESFQSRYDFTSLTYPDIHTFYRRNNCSINVYDISGGIDDDDKVNIKNDDIDIGDGEIEDDDEIEDNEDNEVDEISEDDTECNVNERENEGVVYPLKVAKDIIKKRHVNLLLTEKIGQHHYTTIKHFSRLVSSQISRRKRQHFYCISCMHGFTNKELLKKHRKRSCKTGNAQR